MAGEKKLQKLLASVRPELDRRIYVFCTVSEGEADGIPGIFRFREKEGLTVVTELDTAEALHLDYEYPCRHITLNVHSSLEAVGFLAAITSRLAAAGVSVNAVSAFYHDHLFVPPESVQKVMDLLAESGME